MKKILFTIAFSLAGIFSAVAHAQVVPLIFDPAQSSLEISIDGNSSSSALSGTATLDIQNLGPPSGNAQLSQLDVTADQSLNFSIALGLVSASTAPGDLTVSLVTPGASGTLSASSFDQLQNMAAVAGDLNVFDPLGFAGGSQTVDLSTIPISLFDINSINVTQSGNDVTVASNFTIVESIDLGGTMVNMEIEVSYLATGVAPATVILGDVNLDGSVTFLDISPFISVLAAVGFQAEADCNEDGLVGFLDIAPFIAILASQ